MATSATAVAPKHIAFRTSFRFKDDPSVKWDDRGYIMAGTHAVSKKIFVDPEPGKVLKLRRQYRIHSDLRPINGVPCYFIDSSRRGRESCYIPYNLLFFC